MIEYESWDSNVLQNEFSIVSLINSTTIFDILINETKEHFGIHILFA